MVTATTLRKVALWLFIAPALVCAGSFLLPVALDGCDLNPFGPHKECYLGARDVTAAVVLVQFGSLALFAIIAILGSLPLWLTSHAYDQRICAERPTDCG